LSKSFSDLGLAAELLRSIAEQGYTTPTPVQAEAIPLILAGRDVLAGARTGTGKTAAFTLPLLHRLGTAPARGSGVRALILTPTRELAAQVEASVRTYGRHARHRAVPVFGGVGFTPQVQALRSAQIVVATPGRLLDHMGQKTVNLAHVETLVLDEADRMLDMGFLPDMRRILAALPRQRQNLLFSATFTDEIRRLAAGLLHDPAMVQVAAAEGEAPLVRQRVLPVDAARKRALLAHLVADGDWRQVLVFMRTKHGANRLAEQLCADGIDATAIHGNKSQNARTRALSDFKQGRVRVLVATDIAARGLDIHQLPNVVNYDLPAVPEDYVHRIGRTGRAGHPGDAVSLVSPDDHPELAGIEKLLKRTLDRHVVPGFEPRTAAAAAHPVRRSPPPRPSKRTGAWKSS
jgi:ATP-dependent RNA helicase RhlE